MHFVATNGKGYDLDAVSFPCGTLLRSLSREVLEDRLINEKTPGVVRGMGRDHMIRIYHEHRSSAPPAKVERR